MRKPFQCEGVERGALRSVQAAAAGSANPAFLGILAGLAVPAIIGAVKGALGK